VTFEAVTFDYWDTLMVARPSDFRVRRAQHWLAAFDEAGIAVTAEQLDASFDRLLAHFNECWHANEQFTALDAAAWTIDDLGLSLDKQLRSSLEGAFTWSGDDLLPELAPGLGDALEAIRSAGVRIGIICDVGMTPSTSLRRYLDAHGVLEHFDHWSFSDEVGVYKPDRRIFEHALAGLGVEDPARAVHVGDLRRTDVAGALAMGMGAIRFAGVNDDAPTGADEHPEAPYVVLEHAALLGVVNGG
jgi:FMN phosphatase YigB (HAD superfamily)